jgi:biopolymer transport protein ExbD
MNRAPTYLLAVLVALASSFLLAQNETAVQIRISAGEICLIGDLDVSCSDLGAKLRDLGTPLDATIQLSVDTRASYDATSAAIDSLRRAGYKLKIGYINVQPQ